ncbi:MAG: AAA family ATPase [Clostridiales bacterium]|jgi:predicted ATPase|nr:AAA family ATPase [Clostridiales bacterium]
MLIHSIKLKNFLSFGHEESIVKLQPLNVIIGANSSGKSNFLEAFDFLRAAPSNLGSYIRSVGGIQDLLWIDLGSKSEENHVSSYEENHVSKLEAIFESPKTDTNQTGRLRYKISFGSEQSRFRLIDESIEADLLLAAEQGPLSYYRFNNGNPVINENLVFELHDSNASILSQAAFPPQFPEITFLAESMSRIKLYKDWRIGSLAPADNPQSADHPNQILNSDFGNLALILNQIRMNQTAKRRFLKELRHFYGDVVDFEVSIIANTLMIAFFEKGMEAPIPAKRLSDGVLRLVTLLAMLCNPTLPPLMCIEEPGLGFHPPFMYRIATLLKEASEKCQLIVTTHSPTLVDSFSQNPEAVLVCERSEEGTNLTRLDKVALEPLLKNYRLGELWDRGDIGGNPW